MKKKTFCFDLDNVICFTKKNNYKKSKPNKKVIELINKLYENGHTIKILTARYMGRTNDSIAKANKLGYNSTYKQLKNWELKFHKLYITKPSFDFYVDDKSYNYNDKWPDYLKKNFYKK